MIVECLCPHFVPQEEASGQSAILALTKKWLHSAKPMYGRYVSCYTSVFGIN